MGRSHGLPQLLQLVLDQWQRLGGPEGDPFWGGGLQVPALGVYIPSARLRALLEDAVKCVEGSIQGSPCGGQLLQLALHQRQGLGGPEGDPVRGGGLEVAALGVDLLPGRRGSLLKDDVEGVLGSPQGIASVSQLLQLALHHGESLRGPDGEAFGGGGLEVVTGRVNLLPSRLCGLAIDVMEGGLGSLQGIAGVGQLLQLDLYEGQSLGGPEGQPLRGGGLEITAERVDSRAC